MNRSSICELRLAAIIACCSLAVCAVSVAEPLKPSRDALRPQPNIVHIMADDLGWQDPACYYRDLHRDEPIYETPNMDRLAQNGMRFTQAYAPSPVCAPTRAAYMAGQHTPHTGVHQVMGGTLARPFHAEHSYLDPFYSGRLNIRTPIIADVLKQGGYVTAHFQKWHFGGRGKGYPGPLDYGFDFSWSWRGLHYNDPQLYDPSDPKTADYEGLWRPLSPDRSSGFASSYDPKAPYALDPNDDDRPFDAVVDLSLRWMDKVKGEGKPFFVNFCPSFVHSPFTTRDRKRLAYYCAKMGVPFPTDPGRITDLEPGHKNPYYASMLDSLDWQLGKILNFLETTDDPRNPGHKLIENTYLMLSSDNGGMVKAPIKNGKDQGEWESITDNRPLQGGKLRMLEGGLRIPFIIQGPGIGVDQLCHTPISLIDLFPTYMAMAGLPVGPELALDGCNILPLLHKVDRHAKFADGSVRDSLYWHFPSVMTSASDIREGGCSSAIRKGGWKLRLNHAPEMNRIPRTQLYKLYHEDGSPCDLGESEDLAQVYPAQRERLLADLNAWLEKYQAPKPYKNVNVPGGSDLPGAGEVPAVLKRHSVEDRVEVHVESGAHKSKIVEARLVYTTNGSELLQHNPWQEEWFDIAAEIDGAVITACAPPGMTHGVFYLRDENDFLITSEPLAPHLGEGAIPHAIGASLLEDGYAYRPGLIALLNTARAAAASASSETNNRSQLLDAMRQASAVLQAPVDERAYVGALRNLRHAIKRCDVPQARLPVLNQFESDNWARVDKNNASARGEFPPSQTAEQAFDGDLNTKWLDFAPQASWIQYDHHQPVACSGYRITSANDAPARDPSSWQLLGSNDGIRWATLDSRHDQMWSERHQPRHFSVQSSQPYRFHRFKFGPVRDPHNANSIQIAEIHLLAPDQSD